MKTTCLALAGALALLAAPAAADTKTGVDAWGRGDYKAAVDAWRGPAVAGDPDAQFNLGQAYKLGRGVPADFALAESWYRKAAAQGHVQAEDNFGLALFQNGKRGEALPWLEKSATRGEPRAQYVLGTMLFNGDGVPKDWVRAYALMTRSASAGLPQATATLTQMDSYIPMAQRQQGTVLARQYEGSAQSAQLSPELSGGGRTPAMRGVEMPASNYDNRPAPQLPPTPTPRTTPRPVPVANTPVRPPIAQPAPVRPAANGRWRVQFGAFGEEGNARRLFEKLKGQVGAVAPLQPFLVKAGTLTKLQAGPLSSSAEANRVCAAVKPTGTPCVLVGP